MGGRLWFLQCEIEQSNLKRLRNTSLNIETPLYNFSEFNGTLVEDHYCGYLLYLINEM